MTYRANLARHGAMFGCHSCGAEQFIRYTDAIIGMPSGRFPHRRGCKVPRVEWLEDVDIPRGNQEIMASENRVRRTNAVR